MCNLLPTYMILSMFVASIKSEDEALIFNRYTNALFELPNPIPKDIGDKPTGTGAWATACPASRFDSRNLMKNALIVQQVYEEGNKTSDVKINICNEPYEVSLVFEVEHLNFNFGYAIYYKLKDDEYFHRFNQKKFMTAKEATRFMQENMLSKETYSFFSRKAKETTRSKQNTIQDEDEEIWFKGNWKMGFTWVNLNKLRFDFHKNILIKVAYVIRGNNKWPVDGEQCADYSLGSSVYENIDLDFLYSEKNQKKIFKNLKVPSMRCEGETCPIESPCQLYYRLCLSKWLLIPMGHFVFGNSASSSCSNLATIPIWRDTVEKVLLKVDQYLYSLYRVTGGKLLIIGGVTEDILELPKSGVLGIGKSKIYLDTEKNWIPVPKIIYKIVKYRYKYWEVDSSWFSAVIVIHNDPYYKKEMKLCKKDVTRDWGWDEITKDSSGKDFENIYVCQHDSSILKKLYGGTLRANEQQPTFDLNLLNFPTIKKGNSNIKSSVDEEFKELSAGRVNFNMQYDDLEGTLEMFQNLVI